MQAFCLYHRCFILFAKLLPGLTQQAALSITSKTQQASATQELAEERNAGILWNKLARIFQVNIANWQQTTGPSVANRALGHLAKDNTSIIAAWSWQPSAQGLWVSTQATTVTGTTDDFADFRGKHEHRVWFAAISHDPVAVGVSPGAQPHVSVGKLQKVARGVLQGDASCQSLFDQIVDDQGVGSWFLAFAVIVLIPEGVQFQGLRGHQIAVLGEWAPFVPSVWAGDWAFLGDHSWLWLVGDLGLLLLVNDLGSLFIDDLLGALFINDLGSFFIDDLRRLLFINHLRRLAVEGDLIGADISNAQKNQDLHG